VPQVTLKDLLEAGSHFGHQTKRWNPKMKPYIFGSRNGIYIIDLLKTLQKLKEAGDFLRDLSGQVLFVGTKKQAQGAVEEQAQRCSMPYVTKRWLGGTLTNFTTIKSRVNRMKELQQLDNGDGSASPLTQGKTKKEILRLTRERERLEKYLKGIQEMDRIPKAMFVVDPSREAIAIKEALKLKIPVIAIVDTNCNPDGVNYVLPGNDDAIRAIRLFSSAIADAILEGKTMRKPGEDVEVSGKGMGDIAKELEAAQAAKGEPAPQVEAPVAASPPPTPAEKTTESAEGKN
jgi:small subunit ribosomal protein S2